MYRSQDRDSSSGFRFAIYAFSAVTLVLLPEGTHPVLPPLTQAKGC